MYKCPVCEFSHERSPSVALHVKAQHPLALAKYRADRQAARATAKPAGKRHYTPRKPKTATAAAVDAADLTAELAAPATAKLAKPSPVLANPVPEIIIEYRGERISLATLQLLTRDLSAAFAVNPRSAIFQDHVRSSAEIASVVAVQALHAELSQREAVRENPAKPTMLQRIAALAHQIAELRANGGSADKIAKLEEEYDACWDKQRHTLAREDR